MKELNFDWLLNGSCLLSDVAMAYFTTPQIRLIYFIYLLFIIYLCAGLHVGGL